GSLCAGPRGGGRAPHGRSRLGVPARAAAARGVARHSRWVGRARPRQYAGCRACDSPPRVRPDRHAGDDPPHHQTSIKDTAMSFRPLVLVLLVAACSPKADLVITGGQVWTGRPTGGPRAGAVAIRGDKILAVGDSATIAPV